ncbi:tRNA-guanine transglycosylase family protein [Biscogniauxia mediterranea]|nr:tRNA-guanine transglycosylase family protein [Biscogniauxia mediterranea]
MATPDSDEDMRIIFKTLKAFLANDGAVRLGRLSLPNRRPVDTPNYFGLTSRGAIPHMTPDNVSKHTEISGVYIAIEDFLEHSRKRAYPAIYNIDVAGKEPLHAYTATPSNMTTILGARRNPAVTAPTGNGRDYISIFTSTGFQRLNTENYHRAIENVRPDIAIPLADLTFNESKIHSNAKRQLRMVERTEDWLAEFFNLRGPEEINRKTNHETQIFGPLLPVDYPTQWEYINRLAQDYAERLSGLAIYDANILPDLGKYDSLTHLPRLSLDIIKSPHDILRQVQLGIDLFTVPFLNSTSDAGVALTFKFPPPTDPAESILPLGIDLWSQNNQTSLEPLAKGCGCYACTKHHLAYMQHLLNAKEMLGWTLLQIHNHHVLSDFFAGIRASLNKGYTAFEEDCTRFARVYDVYIPKGTGLRPRARGYHFKSEGGDKKINEAPWENYETAGSRDPTIAAEMAGLAVTGAAGEGKETPAVPEGDSEELDKKGFAEIDR